MTNAKHTRPTLLSLNF